MTLLAGFLALVVGLTLGLLGGGGSILTVPAIVFALGIHLALAASLGVWLFAADPSPAPSAAKPVKSGPEDVHAMRLELEQSRAEIELLRKENQQLRRLLSDRSHAPTNITSTVGSSTNSAALAEAPAHWLTPGGKRHNRDCRYFQKAGGRACDAHEGTACKLCGG